MLPAFDEDNIDFCYIMDNIDVTDTTQRAYSRRSMNLGLWEAQRMPVAAWVKGLGAFSKFPQRSVTVVFGGSLEISVSDRLFRHYDSIDLRRWKRLNECPYWIYLDSFFVFTNCVSTLDAVRFYLESKEWGMFNLASQSPIFHQTRELHRDTSTTLALQECIRMHRASLKSFRLGLGRMAPSDSLKMIQRRLEDVAELLEFYQSTCVTVLEQQRNLLNMTLNLETISQSQSVMRLNGLAFVVLPLSFVASIFGMTTITTPAVWYIVIALPTLIATVGAVFIIDRATNYLQSRKLKKQQKDQPRSYREISWNAPRSWLAKITTTRFGGSAASNTASLDKDLSSSPKPPSQKQSELSTSVFDRNSPGQQQSRSFGDVLDDRSPGQQQSETSTPILDEQPQGRQQPKFSAGFLDRHFPSQQQLVSSTTILNEPSLGCQQLEPSIDILNEPSPGEQQLEPPRGMIDRQSPGQQRPKSSTGFHDGRFKMTIDPLEINSRYTTQFPESSEDEYMVWMKPESAKAYTYRVTGVARVDSTGSMPVFTNSWRNTPEWRREHV